MRFQRVIGEQDENILKNAKKVRRVIFCSGKVYYDFLAERTGASKSVGAIRDQSSYFRSFVCGCVCVERKVTDVALVRLEQIAPFPFDKVIEQVQLYPNAELAWGQEEHMNMGGWSFVAPHFETAVKELRSTHARARIDLDAN